jgi:hypothetical protein
LHALDVSNRSVQMERVYGHPACDRLTRARPTAQHRQVTNLRSLPTSRASAAARE